MKKLVIMFLVSLVLCGCTVINGVYFRVLSSGHSVYYGNFENINTPEDVYSWIRTNIEYEADEVDSWEDPEYTVTYGKGDCDDIALVALNILYVELGIEGQLAGVEGTGRKISTGGDLDHIIIGVNHKYIDPYSEDLYPNIGYYCEFRDVFTIDSGPR